MTREVTVKILDFQATSRPKNLTSLAYKTPVPETCEVDLWQFIKIPAQKHNNDLLFRTNCTKIIVIADCIHSQLELLCPLSLHYLKVFIF